jgi:hypothetical protein
MWPSSATLGCPRLSLTSSLLGPLDSSGLRALLQLFQVQERVLDEREALRLRGMNEWTRQQSGPGRDERGRETRLRESWGTSGAAFRSGRRALKPGGSDLTPPASPDSEPRESVGLARHGEPTFRHDRAVLRASGTDRSSRINAGRSRLVLPTKPGRSGPRSPPLKQSRHPPIGTHHRGLATPPMWSNAGPHEHTRSCSTTIGERHAGAIDPSVTSPLWAAKAARTSSFSRGGTSK